MKTIVHLLDAIHLKRTQSVHHFGKDAELIILHPINFNLLRQHFDMSPIDFDHKDGKCSIFGIRTIFSPDINEEEVFLSSLLIK